MGTMTQKWNPRYVAFAKANGRTPEEQDAIDRAGTHKLEFILWIGQKWAEYVKAKGFHGPHWSYIKGEADHAAFNVMIGA